ncbi:MAG: acetyl-CoA carboxylase biotin carboxyl carrier protein subunit [Myxococcota bacterium]
MRSALASDGTLGSPSVGTWRPAIGLGAPLTPGMVLGTLDRAGDVLVVTAPASAHGVALHVAPDGSWVAFADVLVRPGEGGLGDAADLAAAPSSRGHGDVPADVTVLRADTDGTVYLRPEPGAPSFTTEGAAVEALSTIALVEVMKTFTPVRAPQTGEIVRVCVEEGASVEAGDALFWFRA